MNVDLIIYNAGELVTCAAGGVPKRGAAMRELGIIRGGAAAIAEGRIAAVGTSDEITSVYTAAEMIDAEGRVVMPGFVDPHTHIVYAGNRLDEFELKIKGADYLEILASGGGIISTVKATRAAPEGELIAGARERLDKMLACGTTTCEIKTGYGLDTETELKMLRVIEEIDKTHAITIVPTFLAAHAVPPEFKDDAAGYVELICGEMLPKAWEWYGASHFSGKVQFFADVFAEKNAFSVEQAREILGTAKELGFAVKAHVDQYTNLGGSRLGMELNAASIDHLDAISDEEIDMLAASGTIGVVIPTENFNAGKTQFAPARRLIDAGCAVAISTDYNPGSAPCPSQPMAMAISCRYQKLLPAEAINAATINAAFGIGMGEEVGSLELGKRADLVLLNAEDHRAAVYEFGASPVGRVIIGGKEVPNGF